MAVSIRPATLDSADLRYEILRPIGEGAAGEVYLAKDRESGEQVALKKLRRVDPESVLQLKREFRSLADLHHPNLIELYDLARGDDAWFLTMEYIEGSDLLTYLGRNPNDSLECDIGATRERGPQSSFSVPQPLLAAFQQLARGVHALHRAGMLHRDLKPSNVIVENGRVVVLDFGLVRELDHDGVLTRDALVSGTPAYMAPEQAAGGAALDASADWYAFGVMLYEALSGRLPIDARTATELLLRKTKVDPAPLRGRAGDQRPELQELCMRLLDREPARRPSGDDVLAVFARMLHYDDSTDTDTVQHASGLSTPISQTRARDPKAKLFGRSHALAQLTEALRSAQRGQAVIMHVAATSGMGKSSLVERFLSGLVGTGALALRSRCYERESIPFKALDGLMDALVRELATQDDLQVGHLLPSDVAALAQLFPMFERLRAVQRLLERDRSQDHAMELRQRAESALSELFVRLSSRQPLVIWIDDLHWGDLDSVSILRAWRTQLAAARVLIVISYRSDETETSACLSALLEPDPRNSLVGNEVAAPRAIEQRLELDALSTRDVHSLCERRFGALAAQHPELIAQIASESRGNPFLVAQLAALAEAKLARGDTDLALSIEQLVVKTSALLPAAARELLNVLALADRPLPPKLALQAAGATQDGRSQLHALRGLQLIRTREVQGAQLIEVYHDRVRDGVRQQLSAAERQELHGRLLDAAEGSEQQSDVAWLHALALGAGRREAALSYGVAAAERASAALAFEHAIGLYQTCLELSPEGATERRELWQALAFALACTRQGVRAADAYLEAAKLADPDGAVPLLRLAASHLVRSGDYVRGEALTQRVLAALQLDLPKSSAGLVAAIAWERTRMSLRGMDYQPRSEAEVSPELLQKIDLFWELSIENQAHRPLRAALLEARCLRWALQAGEPGRVARAFCLTSISGCVSGTSAAAERSDALLARAEQIALDALDESLRGNVYAARAICGSLLGRLNMVIKASEQAERIYRADARGTGRGDYYHRSTMVATRIGTMIALGDLRGAARDLRSALEDARAVGNRSTSLHLTLAQVLVDETEQRVHRSRARLDAERAMLPKDTFGTLHTLHMLAVMRTACWLGDFKWAEPYVNEDWPKWQRSPVRLSAFISLLALAGHARFLLNRHVVEGRSGDAARLVRDDLRAMSRLRPTWRMGSRARSEARLAFLSGQPLRAAELLRTVCEVAEAEGAVAEAARDRHALGLIIGGSEGTRLVREARHFLRERGMVDPLADLRANYPELLR